MTWEKAGQIARVAAWVLVLGLLLFNLWQQQMTRKMLNARAEIQTTLVEAVRDGRKLTADEDKMISDLWEQAEYDRVRPLKK